MARDRLADAVLADRIHIAKRRRPHVAQEYRDKGSRDVGEEICRGMTRWAYMAVLGKP